MIKELQKSKNYKNKYILHQILQFADFEVEQKETLIAISDTLSEMIKYCVDDNHRILEHSWCTKYITINDKPVSRSEILDTIVILYSNNDYEIKNKLS